MSREYRIPGARVTLLKDRLLVQFRSGPSVSVAVGDQAALDYLSDGPVRITVDDGTGQAPTVTGNLQPAPDDFGDVLTEIEFRGGAHGVVEDEASTFVVTASGPPKLGVGVGVFPLDDAQLEGAGKLGWACAEPVPQPHNPK